MELQELERLSWKLRGDTVDIIMSGKAGHIGGDMSVLNLLLVLYENHLRITPQTADAPDRDRFVLSKGHCVEALYAVLAHKGFLDLATVKQEYFRMNTPYIGHPNNRLAGIEMNSGSLGHGLSVCVGMALAAKMDRRSYRVYTIMGDGELAEGSVWEGAMAASHYGLDNLCAVIDRNGLQISGATERVMAQDPLQQRWTAFGWNVLTVDGTSLEQIDRAYAAAAACRGKPTLILANTVKGFGSAVMEGKASWHHKLPTPEEYARIMEEFAERGQRV